MKNRFLHQYEPDSHLDRNYYYSVYLERCSFECVNLHVINVAFGPK